MKYKNICSAIHNFGHSFTSLMNYVDSDYVIDELSKIHRMEYDIEIDWLSGGFEPGNLASERLTKSIGYWREWLEDHLASHNVDIERLHSVKFAWPARKRKFMLAIDDRGKEYKIYVNETR